MSIMLSMKRLKEKHCVLTRTKNILCFLVCDDAMTHSRKGKTVMTDKERYESVRHCKWVDEVIEAAPWVVDREFLDKHKVKKKKSKVRKTTTKKGSPQEQGRDKDKKADILRINVVSPPSRTSTKKKDNRERRKKTYLRASKRGGIEPRWWTIGGN